VKTVSGKVARHSLA